MIHPLERETIQRLGNMGLDFSSYTQQMSLEDLRDRAFKQDWKVEDEENNDWPD